MLEIKNITKKYNGRIAVDNLSMSIGKGEMIGLIGPNGAGKSTLISMISTIINPTSGDILYDGKSIYQAENLKKYRKKIALVPQEIALYPHMSGLDNLRFFGRAHGLKNNALTQKIEEIADIIGIKERLSDKVRDYSGGMARRLNIGVALLNSPEILIMDEPTVGIDPQSRNYILESVKKFNETGMSILYTTHYMEEVEHICKQVYIMDLGKIIKFGNIDDMLNQFEASEQDAKRSLENVFLKLTGSELRD